jgi:hypothetical protein
VVPLTPGQRWPEDAEVYVNVNDCNSALAAR